MVVHYLIAAAMEVSDFISRKINGFDYSVN